MAEFPPPQEGYDPKLQQVVPQLGPEDLAVAAEAAATAAGEMPAAPVLHGGDIAPPAPAAALGEGNAFANSQTAAKTESDGYPQQQQQQQEPYEGQYTSTDVPVPPMMEWNNHHNAASAPSGQSMDLHSPIHAPEPPAAAAQVPAPAPTNPNEPVYASYHIPPPGHMHHPPPPHHHPPPPHLMPHQHYDPYAQWPHVAYASPPVPVPYGHPPPPVVPVRPPPTPHDAHHNSNFWLQEEEERFLLGLRLYGWGQWKRIQTVVQTRSNKQIKSHAQKREKVNPDIKFKYAKGKSRRGRLSASSSHPSDPNGSPYRDGQLTETNLALDDPSLPPMEELWKDVYGTNNGVGPNSRLRRYRSNALHQKWLEETGGNEGEVKASVAVATDKTPKVQDASGGKDTSSTKKKLTPEGQYIQDHKVLQQSSAAQPAVHPAPVGMYYNPPPYHHHGYIHGVSPPRIHNGAPPPYSYGAPPPPTTAMTMHHPMPHPPVVHKPDTAHSPPQPPTPSTPLNKDEALRPGMRVYACSSSKSNSWSPGIIYSAKVDPQKSIDPNVASVPLVYHVQYENGSEDPEVQEEFILSKAKYDAAMDDLEYHYDIVHHDNTTQGTEGSKSAILEAGTPVYAQWMERSNPTLHGRWLPGTIGSIIHSSSEPNTADGTTDTAEVNTMYHVLFDNATEKQVSSRHVLDRKEYHEWIKRKSYNDANATTANNNNNDGSAAVRMPIGEIYNLFSREENNNNEGMDLLFTASQMAGGMDTKKRGHDGNVEEDQQGHLDKKRREEEEPPQQEGFAVI
ncbi:hypothetical protein ACHAXN_008262 [Cyclotella atomus]